MRQSYKENVITISLQDDNESEVAIQSPRSPIANEDLKKEEHQIRIEISNMSFSDREVLIIIIENCN